MTPIVQDESHIEARIEAEVKARTRQIHLEAKQDILEEKKRVWETTQAVQLAFMTISTTTDAQAARLATNWNAARETQTNPGEKPIVPRAPSQRS